ncbi:MAG: hypothetical protein ACJA01_004543 [Saprospiraceae bacterium]
MKQQKELLLDDGFLQVIDNIKKLKTKNENSSAAKETALRYYEEHEDRMIYKTYKDKGLLIGSGPIEAAHRNVIQQRLKLSGQK